MRMGPEVTRRIRAVGVAPTWFTGLKANGFKCRCLRCLLDSIHTILVVYLACASCA